MVGIKGKSTFAKYFLQTLFEKPRGVRPPKDRHVAGRVSEFIVAGHLRFAPVPRCRGMVCGAKIMVFSKSRHPFLKRRRTEPGSVRR
jgi:hypothetical protein